MSQISTGLKVLASNRWVRWGRWLVLPAAAVAVVGTVLSQAVPPTIPAVSLAAEPLYARGARAKPTLTLALSVEFPTVGAQYVNVPNTDDDNSYDSTKEYIGYFDADGCYTYNDGATPKRFDRLAGVATIHKCGTAAFSGNYMNWASSSAVDILRYALTGGDRILDTSTQTVLQRAYLPRTVANNYLNFWNKPNFPSKQITATQAAGAVPTALIGAATILYAANCENRIYFGTQKTGSCASPGNNGNLGATLTSDSDHRFYARVSVCTSDASGTLTDPRPDLCLRYPNGNYKPVGNLQKYSDRIRVAAFGYVNDNSDNPQRQGGVLRAPMKYVGPTYYDSNFSLVSGANPNAEWDSTTGVLKANPDSAAEGKSGVTNYLNQFGRTQSTTLGLYKRRDPVGELYYEALRYLQGLPPTPAAVASLSSFPDGFPAFATWNDPHPAVSGMADYSCVRNNILAIGDANTNEDRFIPGNPTATSYDPIRPANPSGNEPDFYFWTKVVGGFESNNAVSYLDGSGASQTSSNFNTPYNTARWGMENQSISSGSYYLAGLAYWANTHDIRGSGWSNVAKRRIGMRVKSYMLDVNEFGQNSPTAARHNSQYFLAAKYGGFDDASGTGSPFKAADGSLGNVNWEDSARPGEAKSYYLSSSAQAVLDGLDQIFANIASQANSIAGGAISTQRLTTVAGSVYQAQFDPAAWSGDLAAYSVSASASGVVSVGSVATWKASDELAAKTNRNIVIGKTIASASATATDFNWSAIDADAQAALRAPPYAASGAAADPVTTGQARLNFLRGDRSNEAPAGLLMRKRANVLGDVVNSAVAFSGAPSQQVSDPAYATFYTTYKNRKHALFVGANDGMLHAFDPDRGSVAGHPGGDELFAYIPSWMIPKLGALTSPSYVHQSYVDASPVVAEVKVGATWATGAWKTVLVGGTGGGGQGVYALDVSDPNAFDASKVMWEFSDRDDADMGNVIGKPQLLKLRTSALADPADYQYFALVASGVNNYVNDGQFSTTGKPALFLLDLSKPPSTPWTLGTNYFKISFPALTTTASGMVGFTARLGAADAVSTLYGGDLQGNLWKLDFSQAIAGKADWNLGKLSYFKDGSSNPMPMYVAKDASSNRQAITMEPALVFGPNRSIIVSFGTGKFVEVSDNVTTGAPQQSVYAILDNNSVTPDSVSPASAIAGRTRLMAGTVSLAGGTVTVGAFTWGRSLLDTDPAGVRSGWYFDFGNAGERQISGFAVLLGRLIFGSVIPAVNSCDNGNGNLYIAEVASGNATLQQSNVGILGEPLVTQVGSSTVTTSDTTGLRNELARFQVILQGSGGLGAPPALSQLFSSYVGRLSWREISNYQQLRNNP